MPPILLTQIPGFANLPDSVFDANQTAFGAMIARVSENAEFGMVNIEIFPDMFGNGDTVPLPVSPIDGYVYSRDELLYIWNPDLSTNKQTGWIESGSGSLFFCAWYVDQSTGQVYSLEWYRNNGSGGSRTQTNDGQIHVYTIGQRQRHNIIVSPTPSFNAISEGNISTNQPLTQSLGHALNGNAKFGAINREVFYCGEFVNGQTVSRSTLTSSYDGYEYNYSECKFIACWRWTTQGSTLVQPPEDYGQLGPFSWSINSSGAVTVQVITNDNDGNVTFPSGYGRISVFAFAVRSATPGSLSRADSFAEVLLQDFMPGGTERASNVLQVKRNADEAVLTPEFFGPTDYGNGDTIPVPTSPVDGYTYDRSELTYIWSWSNTMNYTGNGGRLPVFYGTVNQSTGAVAINCWHLGSHYDDPYNEYCRITVVTLARRSQAPISHPVGADAQSPSDITSSTLQQEASLSQLYMVSFDMGGGRDTAPATSESLLRHIIPTNIASVTFEQDLPGAAAACRVAAADHQQIVIYKGTEAIGTLDFTAANGLVGSFTFSTTVAFGPGDVLEFVANASDSAVRGIYFTMPGTRA